MTQARELFNLKVTVNVTDKNILTLNLLTASLSLEWLQRLVHLKKLTKKSKRTVLPFGWVGDKVRNTIHVLRGKVSIYVGNFDHRTFI